ncbi:hypothetical protein DFH08DRAFT_976170 [Mycena albidolilacea]|uniref:Tat pathway signal sequence n=1 Tax=Mycena albidolilacea TaxID=1033008 RepID=A0AAD6Z2Z3_9AGAR|nr:hypothetical protein DFH08DRAFT_976170 [Mycena albidolilacea]
MSKDQEYQPLISDTLEEVDVDAPSPQSTRICRFSTWVMHSGLPALVAIETISLVILVAVFLQRPSQAACGMPLGSQKVLYSPALSAVEHEVQVYHLGFPGDLSPFQMHSSPELDQMWSDLYNCEILQITKEEATHLPNKTHAIPGDPGHYIAELDVFHNLHCLNRVRMALDSDYYSDWRISTSNNYIPTQKSAAGHVAHCIDWLRQSIMCHADTSVIVWQWDARANASLVKGNVAHTCRKFDKITEWAKQRVLVNAYDPTVHIKDDIVVPILHQEMS